MKLKFAWWPVTMTSGRRIWFRHYWLYQRSYDLSTGRPSLFNQYFEFTETEAERTFRLLRESVIQNRNVWNEPELTKQDQNVRNIM